MNQEILFLLKNELYDFFLNNLTVDNYEINFVSAEFYLMLVDDPTLDFLNNESVLAAIEKSLTR
jgi:hypothetical protein